MRRLLPDVVEDVLDGLYLELDFPAAPDHRPFVYLDMVASVDGAATVHGRTAELGGDADHLAFPRLREWADAILVGASTVRVEHYGSPAPSAEARERRRRRGQREVPELVVVTASLALDPAARAFADPDRRPVLLVPEDADEERLAPLRAVADVVQAGTGRVDLRAAFGALRDRGIAHLLCEGGPHLNAELLRAGLVDDLFLTISPQLVGESDLRIVAGGFPEAPAALELLELREHEGELLTRYRLPDEARW